MDEFRFYLVLRIGETRKIVDKNEDWIATDPGFPKWWMNQYRLQQELAKQEIRTLETVLEDYDKIKDM